MKLNLISTKEILDYEKEIGIELVVNERELPLGRLKKYYVLFENSSVKDGNAWIGVYGEADNIDMALSDYCIRISGQTLIFNTIERREIKVPKLIHTKYLNR